MAVGYVEEWHALMPLPDCCPLYTPAWYQDARYGPLVPVQEKQVRPPFLGHGGYPDRGALAGQAAFRWGLDGS